MNSSGSGRGPTHRLDLIAAFACGLSIAVIWDMLGIPEDLGPDDVCVA